MTGRVLEITCKNLNCGHVLETWKEMFGGGVGRVPPAPKLHEQGGNTFIACPKCKCGNQLAPGYPAPASLFVLKVHPPNSWAVA